MGKTPPDLQMYKNQEDSPYVAHARNLMETGYKGLNDNVGKVNTMDGDTVADINSRLGAIQNRANQDFDINYRSTIANQLANEYGKFGTIGGTSSLYRNDMTNRTEQRKLADLAYEQAKNYEGNVNNELKRRYDTINMYNNLYGYGSIPQKYDDQNYKLSLTNQDRAYQNDFNRWKTDQLTQQALTSAGTDIGSTALAGLAIATMGPAGVALAPMIMGAGQGLKGTLNASLTPNATMTYNGNTGWGSALGAGNTSGTYSGWGTPYTGMDDQQAEGWADALSGLSGTKKPKDKSSQIFTGNSSDEGVQFLRRILKDYPELLKQMLSGGVL